MATETHATANGVKTTGIGSVSAAVSGENRPNNNHNQNNNISSTEQEAGGSGPGSVAAAKKQWRWLSWMRIFPPNGRNSASARVVPKSSEVSKPFSQSV